MAIDRSRLPEVADGGTFAFPRIAHHRLANGLAVRTVEHRSAPVVTFVLVVDGGAGADRQGQEGLMALTADMVDEGTGALSAIVVVVMAPRSQGSGALSQTNSSEPTMPIARASANLA